MAERREQAAEGAGTGGAATTSPNGSPQGYNGSGPTAWVTAVAMEKWLVEVGFLEELFGSSMHVELVRKVLVGVPWSPCVFNVCLVYVLEHKIKEFGRAYRDAGCPHCQASDRSMLPND